MTFVDDVKEFLFDQDGEVYDISSMLGVRLVETETHDERRWYNVKHSVYERRTVRLPDTDLEWVEKEYVLVEHCEPATELQEDGDFPEPEVFAVEPYVVEVVKYKPC